MLMMKIGVSECLLGTQCRYDGTGAKDKYVVNVLQKYFELEAYCPEKIIFGTPRETIRQVEVNNTIEIHTHQTKKNVTPELEKISNELADEALEEELCGFILKSKSPTCGMERVKVYQPVNAPSEKRGVGLFAKALRERYPYLPMEEEGRLEDAWLRENFLMQIFAYKGISEFMRSKPKMKELVAFHTSYKYLIYSKSTVSYKILGNIVANNKQQPLEEILKTYHQEFLIAINQKGNISKTYNVLLHIYGYFKKLISADEKEHMLTAIEEFKEGIIPLIAVIKLLNLYVKRFEMGYLKEQKFLNPYPAELGLRSDIKAFK
ncbi:MAG: COG1683: Uncharacterized conserved protein / FIG143828: Hypothetical protein YbgA [uncultured Sulfurovum sp.]|uniref:DUF1722 domain-containing protein n=1 Tax=uncultured Sulfurovum sp. TaxID=269237 RepID=A0A6S6SXQ9_9BACT|nr:MAG: COG1683: Uncharacterized conserved protein / FIG143828: Hypothetical protein YbgA [uncultured Sulfurovum sp.]